MSRATRRILPLSIAWRSAGVTAALCFVSALVMASGACSLALTADGLTGGVPDAGATGDTGVGDVAAGDVATGDVAADVDAPDLADVFEVTSCDPCQDPSLLRLACRPSVQDEVSGPPIVYATRTMRTGMALDAPDDWQTLGFDRDCMNTTALGTPSTCVLPSSPEHARDGLAGRDNSFGLNFGQLGRLLHSLGIIHNDIETGLNHDLELGYSGWTLTLESFNHTRNDPRVVAVFRLSEGTTTDTGQNVPATWDGTDLWSIDPASLTTQGQPRYADDNAFVVDGVLVAKMPEGVPFAVQVEQGRLNINLTELVLTARLSDDYSSIEEGTISGVWPLSQAVDAAVSFATKFGLCPPNPVLLTVRTSMEQAADIRGDLIPAPAAACNGISFGMGFTAQAAKLGPVGPVRPDQPDVCADAGDGG